MKEYLLSIIGLEEVIEEDDDSPAMGGGLTISPGTLVATVFFLGEVLMGMGAYVLLPVRRTAAIKLSCILYFSGAALAAGCVKVIAGCLDTIDSRLRRTQGTQGDDSSVQTTQGDDSSVQTTQGNDSSVQTTQGNGSSVQ